MNIGVEGRQKVNAITKDLVAIKTSPCKPKGRNEGRECLLDPKGERYVEFAAFRGRATLC